MNKFLNLIFLLFLINFFLIIPNYNDAKEILIYADSITYDKDENIIAKGNAKIIQDNKLIFSDLIIYNQIDQKILLPSKFTFRDENNNFFEGENGFFQKNLNIAQFDNPKIKLNDGSRLIGDKFKETVK